MSETNEKYSPADRAERLWRMGMATQLDVDGRALANALVEEIVNDPEQAAHLIAALVSQLTGE